LKTSLLALIAALLATPVQAAGYHSSGWVAYGKPRAAPEIVLTTKDCGEPACRTQAWKKLLEGRGETELDAPIGGASYRVLAPGPQGLYVGRLDISGDGRATLTESLAGQPPKARNLPSAKLEAFLAAVEASQFKAAQAAPRSAECTFAHDLVFEALVDEGYKFVVQPCADEAGLAKAVEILRGG
jgi:hypothetical protein